MTIFIDSVHEESLGIVLLHLPCLLLYMAEISEEGLC